MSEISRSALFGKLDRLAYKAVESATVFCKLRGNPYVELVHWIQQILNTPDSDLHRIVRHFELDSSRLAKDITESLDRLPRGATAITDFSPHLENAVERGWVYSTLMFGEPRVRTGHLLVGMLKTSSLRNALVAMSRQFEAVKVDDLTQDFDRIVRGSPEDKLSASDGSSLAAPGEASGAMAPAPLGKQEALKRFATDLTERARKGEIDPVTGRDEEIRQIVDILMRRRQNNPILTGEAGVGKTAVVEGFATRLVRGDVPPALQDVSLFTLDIGLLQAGASMKGEFENRLRQVIEDVQSSPRPIILFVDEAHTLIGAGGAQGTGDAANLLKPALARGTLRTIAATTWAEYKKYIEKDPALTRRFQVVQVAEPSEHKAILMVRGVASALEKHHRVQVLDEAIEAAVRLSHRYIPARQLPDKAVGLLDTACARVAVSQHAVPPALEDSRRTIEALQIELEIIGREEAVGIDASARRTAAAGKLAASEQRRSELDQRWQAEREVVDRILAIRASLRKGGEAVEGTGSKLEGAAQSQAAGETPSAEQLSPEERAKLLAELSTLHAKLTELQGESPLILPSVDERAVASVVQDWTGVPVGRMVKNELEAVLKLADTLNQRVIGQRHALEMIAKRIQTSRARLDNPNKPIGVFMLCGPSGVGKTETALALAEAL
jgi:type VI secretion system protein VasG